VPQSVDRIENRAHIPPRFNLAAMPAYLLAPQLTLHRQGASDVQLGCHCALDLSLPQGVIVEDDVTVDLQVRWFVDYDPAVPRSTGAVSEYPLPGQLSAGGSDRPKASFAFETDALGIVTDGTHVVEVVIAERDGFDDANTTLPHRAIKPDYEAIVYRFFVDALVQQVSSESKCPQQAPSVREPASCQ